jgi:hypothetical protein
MSDIKTLQAYLIKEIEDRHFTRRADTVEAFSKLLGVGKDAIYRRLRGDSFLLPEEIALLARTYQVSLDTFIFQRSDAVYFTYNPFVKTIRSFDDFLAGFTEDLTLLTRLPEAHILYASAEIPFFYYMFFPPLFSFKMYVFGRTVWHFDYLQNRPFDLDIIPVPLIQQAESVLKLYRSLPSKELWSLNIMDNTLNQIEYHVNAGGFKNGADALHLCDCMTALVNHMEQMNIHAKKFSMGTPPEGSSGARFDLYHNEMIYTNNTIFVKSKIGRAIYTTYGNPNFLKTSDERMCDFTEGWFNSLLDKSVNLQNERGRRYFFDRLRKRVEIVKKRIAQILETPEDGY